jgi:tryptophanyl-tRNA synthetase
MVERLFSGVQPSSGALHIGNWLGALRNWVTLLDTGRYDAIFSVVDAHAVTVDYEPK